jgi:hypothetical protein
MVATFYPMCPTYKRNTALTQYATDLYCELLSQIYIFDLLQYNMAYNCMSSRTIPTVFPPCIYGGTIPLN